MAPDKAFSVRGMHCSACAARVQSALESVAGVRGATVSLEHHQVTIDADSPIEREQLATAVQRAGDYELGLLTDPVTGAARAPDESAAESQPEESLYPLLLIVAFILGTTILIAVSQRSLAIEPMMRHFMAGFFLVFSFFKLLDLPGFVAAYRGYDLVAGQAPWWGWAYPFVELALGVAYLLVVAPVLVNAITLVLMLVGSVGVLKALIDKRTIRCACLGTALNLPMTKVTLVEDLTMAAMAAIMLTPALA